MVYSHARIIELTVQKRALVRNTRKDYCYTCGDKFDKDVTKVVKKGGGKHSHWYHVDCARQKNIL